MNNGMSNEEFIRYFKRLSKDDKIAAFGELFERFKNAGKEREKVKSDYDKAVSVLDNLKWLPDEHVAGGYENDGWRYVITNKHGVYEEVPKGEIWKI